MFIQAVEAAALVRNNSMGLKYSGLMVTELLRRLNGIANTLKAMFDAGVEPGKPFVSSAQKVLFIFFYKEFADIFMSE